MASQIETRIAEIVDLVIKNNDAIRSGSATTSTIASIASKVRAVMDIPGAETPKLFYARIFKAISEYMKVHYADPLISAKGNSRELFAKSASFLKPITSIENSVRFTFLTLDTVMRRNGVFTAAAVPMLSLAEQLSELRPAICQSLLSRMDESREGGDVSREAVRNVVDLIRKLNYQLDIQTNSSHEEDTFAQNYCNSVKCFYEARAAEKFSSLGSVVAYATWAGRRINEEHQWLKELSMDYAWERSTTNQCLKNSLTDALVNSKSEGNKAVVNVMDVVDDVDGGLAKELREGNDVSDLFALLELIKSTSDAEDGVKRVSEAYYSYVLRSTRAILDAPEPPPEPVPEGQKPKPRPKHTTVVFKELMAFVEHHLLTVWPKQFKGNSIVIASFDKALTELLRDHKTYDYIPRAHSDFCGEFIRSLPEDGLRPEVLDRLSVLKKVFVCITQKDEFIPHYKAALARRLLRPNFYRAVEGHLLHDIKSVVGNADVYHLESMIRDIETSTALTKAFCESRMATIDSKLKLTFIPTSRQHWPALNVTTATIPPAIGQYLDMYEKFYNAKFPSRRLEWAYDISNAAVHVAFAAGPKEVSGSLMQIMVMLALDGSPSGVSIEALAAALGVSVMTATDVLASCVLSLHKVVRPCVIPPPGTRPRLRPEDKFTLNEGFKAPVRKIDLPQVQTSKAKVTDVETEVEQRRNLRTQIEIIRYMKSHGKSLYAEMVEYVLTNLRRSFDAQQSMIKTQLDNLIDKQFVERDPDNRNLLHYIA